VDGNGRPTTVCVAELLVGAPLSNLDEAQAFEQGDDLAWLESGQCPHLRNLDGVVSDELGLELRFAILQEHAHDFLQVALQFVEGPALGVSAIWKRPFARVLQAQRQAVEAKRRSLTGDCPCAGEGGARV
jgi:hypothetical protein